MENFDIKEYASIISGLITAISTLAGVGIANYFNLKSSKQSLKVTHEKEKAQRKLEKIEEFYLLFEKWERNLSHVYLAHLSAYKGEITYNDVMNEVSQEGYFLPADIQKIQMILNIYIPELIDEYKKVDAARSKVVPYLMSDPKENSLTQNDFIRLQKSFESSCSDFKNKVSKLANDL